MTVKYVPMRDDVLVQFIRPEKTKGGLVVVNATFGDAWPRCRVLAIGPDAASCGLAVGDVVLVDAAKGYAVNDGLAMVSFDDHGIVCKVEGHSDDDLYEVEQAPQLVEPSGKPVGSKGRRIELARGNRH